jgi:hypothetical protein
MGLYVLIRFHGPDSTGLFQRRESTLPLPSPSPRQPAHTRQVSYTGYRREDGLWDIEATLLDTKPIPFSVPGERSWSPNEPIHQMSIRLTVDAQLVVQAVQASMDDIPHGDCPLALPPMDALVGARLSAGWRRTIEEKLGGTAGCAHVRELLFNMATAAFQTVAGVFESADPQVKPPHLDRCVSWRTNSDLVSRRYPMFFKR